MGGLSYSNLVDFMRRFCRDAVPAPERGPRTPTHQKQTKVNSIMKRVLLLIAAISAAISFSQTAVAQCTTTTTSKTMTLNADCTTTSSIIVPNGLTFDGAGHTITAVDPAGGHFVGGVIQNGGSKAN